MLASLSHPNIATIFGLEEIDGQRLPAMELAEGEDLSALIARGPIPPGAALPIAGQIAEALSEAHEKGVVHRDFKPANVQVSSDGKVKILDFGLARMSERETAARPESTAASPTLSDAGTQTGVILGTAAYMSPEQARGQSVDKRADIWAFGSMFFEMLTGRAAFAESTVSDTLATVLTRDPELVFASRIDAGEDLPASQTLPRQESQAAPARYRRCAL